MTGGSRRYGRRCRHDYEIGDLHPEEAEKKAPPGEDGEKASAASSGATDPEKSEDR